MDVLLVTGRFPQRSETFIYRKATALAARGHRVTVASRGDGDWELYPDPLPPGMSVEVTPPDGGLRDPRRAFGAAASVLGSGLRAPRAARELLARCRSDSRTSRDPFVFFLRHLVFLNRRFDAVHFEFLGGPGMHPFAAELTGAPIVVSCRGSDLHMLELQPQATRESQLHTLRTADAIHCVSTELAELVAKLTGRRDGVVVNRPAVDLARIAPRPPRTSRGPLSILASGRLTWKKGFDYLLTALGALVKRDVDVRAEILGDGELKQSLRYSVGDLGLDGKVSFPGGVRPDEVIARLQTTDLFVLPSLDEGISNAVLEAMASGVPVVTTAVGGMTEAVTHGREGLVVPPRDAAALASAIEEIARDPSRAAAMGRAARARAEAEFSIERQVTTFEQLYEQLVSR